MPFMPSPMFKEQLNTIFSSIHQLDTEMQSCKDSRFFWTFAAYLTAESAKKHTSTPSA